MMKIKGYGRSLAAALGLVLAACFGTAAWADAPVQMAYFLTGCVGDYSAQVEKFKVELVYAANAKVEHTSTVSSDLRREGHGYRQLSAATPPEVTTSPS